MTRCVECAIAALTLSSLEKTPQGVPHPALRRCPVPTWSGGRSTVPVQVLLPDARGSIGSGKSAGTPRPLRRTRRSGRKMRPRRERRRREPQRRRAVQRRRGTLVRNRIAFLPVCGAGARSFSAPLRCPEMTLAAALPTVCQRGHSPESGPHRPAAPRPTPSGCARRPGASATRRPGSPGPQRW